MIIKVTRGNDFTGAIDYIARLGIYARKDSARVIALERLYDLRTAASQLGYDAARDPSRSRPVVHLIARAERGLSDDQYLDLARRMLRAAGLEGRRFIAAAHDDDGHLHAVASEVDEDGAAPPRILWHKEEKRVVTAEEAKALPRGAVTGRAWDSHLAWRLTRVAREVEIEWNLRRLSSSAKANTLVEPRREQWQKERLARTGKVSLQDRYWDEVRVALTLPTWDARAAALNAHALVIRAHEVGGRVRGLQVQSLSDAQDFVKISAFEMGGMAKLDASAGQPFMEWAAQERRQLINLTKPATSRNPGMIAMQAAFKAHQKDWRRREAARFAAWRQRKRDTVAISEAMDDFASRFRPILTVSAFRQARAEHRRGLKDVADRRLAAALADVGAATPKPVFIDFVKERAGAGDTAATGVYRDIVGDVSETRRNALDRIAAMARELVLAARTLRERRDRLRQDVAAAAMALRRSADDLAHRAAMENTRLKTVTRRSAGDLRARMADLAERLARRLDEANHRIYVEQGVVSVDRWQPSPIEREIMTSPAHRRMFEREASIQTSEVEALRDDVRLSGAARRVRDAVVFDAARSGIGNPRVLRWANEPEVIAALHDVDGRRRVDQARAERDDAGRRQREAAAALDRLRAAAVARTAALSAWLGTSMAADLRRAGTILRGRQAELALRERKLREEAAIAVPAVAPSMDRAALLAAMTPGGRVGGAEHTYRNLWRTAIEATAVTDTIDRATIDRIEIDVACAMIHRGFTEVAVRTMVRDHSPLRTADTQAAAEVRAGHVLDRVLTDPRTRRIRDEKMAEQAERQDRAATVAKLTSRRILAPADTRFVDLWQEILDERPLDTTVAVTERNRAVDHEVATVMLLEGVVLGAIRSSMMRLSPAFGALPSGERPAYVEEQFDALDHVLRRMPPDQRERAGPKPVSARALARMAEAGKAARATGPCGDGSDRISGKLPGMPPSISDVAVIIDGKATIDGFELKIADADTARLGGQRGETPAATAGTQEPLFDDAGRPLPHVRKILDGIRTHRAIFRLDQAGRLTAPEQPPEHQERLASLLADPRFKQLALAAYRGTAGTAGVAAAIGDATQL